MVELIVMKKLMHKIMLDCEVATQLISLKRYKKLTFLQRIQLSLHLMACKYCARFAKYNDLVDESIEHLCSTSKMNETKLSVDKKNELRDIIEKNDK